MNMNKGLMIVMLGAVLIHPLAADVRVRVKVGVGHPIRRPLPQVVVRRPIVVAPAVRYVPLLTFRRTIVALPPRNTLIWEDRETIRRNENWVEMSFSVNQRGRALYFTLDGRAAVDFAEIHYGNGEVQVIDFDNSPMAPGTYLLHDIRDGREVRYVRMIGKSRTPQSTFTVYMAR